MTEILWTLFKLYMSSAMKEKNLFPVSKAPMNDKADSCVFYVLSLISRLSPIFLVFWQKIMRLAGYWQKKKKLALILIKLEICFTINIVFNIIILQWNLI